MQPRLVFVAFVLAIAASSLQAAEPAAKGHPFACTDYTQGKVFIVGSDGKVEWEYPAPLCNDLWVLPGGNLLFNTGHGVKEVTREKKVVFQYDSTSGIYACQRLANGNTFLGECEAGRLLDVAPDGKIVKEVRLLPEGTDGGSAYMRNARRLLGGGYLVAHYGSSVVREYDAQGKMVREIAAPGGPHSVARRPGGNTLVACGDGKGGSRCSRSTRKARRSGRCGARTCRADPKFMAGFQRLPNGNTVLCNWLGHGHLGQGPHVMEVTPEGKVVWTFADHQAMQTISNIQLLDVPGDVTKGEIIH